MPPQKKNIQIRISPIVQDPEFRVSTRIISETDTQMKSFHWTLIALIGLAGALGVYALSGDFALRISSASTVDIRLDCPESLTRDKGLTLDSLPGVDRVLNTNPVRISSAELMVDHARKQGGTDGELLGYAFNLRTPDGNLIVSRNHTAGLSDLDRLMAAQIAKALEDYRRMAEEHDLAGKGVVVENF